MAHPFFLNFLVGTDCTKAVFSQRNVRVMWEEVVSAVTAARGPFQQKPKTGQFERLAQRCIRLH